MGRKRNDLSWSQRAFLVVLADGEWHDCPVTIPGSSVRGLMSRGLIERKDSPNEHPWTWIREGKFRLIKTTTETREDGDDG